MYAGVIKDIDPQKCFGLIESDTGEIVLFSRDSLRPNCEPQALTVGQRVEFTIDKVDPAPHASQLKPERHH
jgi:cold shock CspA family protein